MDGVGPAIAAASDEDLPAIRALLEAAGLPSSDVGRGKQVFLVARAGGALAGAVGLERHGDAALLRSLVVAPEHRGAGLGGALAARIIAEARRRGLREAFLLTGTAERYCQRLGFERVARAALPPAVGASEQARSLCPASAVAMRMRL